MIKDFQALYFTTLRYKSKGRVVKIQIKARKENSNIYESLESLFMYY